MAGGLQSIRSMVFALARVAALATFGLGGWVATSAAAATPAFACPIAPGTSACAPDVLTVSPSATLVASQNGTITAGAGSSMIVANFTENVYRDPTNPYCGTCLDWVVKVSNAQNSTDAIERVTVSNFTSYLTDIGVDSNGAPGLTNNGTVTPNNVERNGSGSVLSWDFNSSSPLNAIDAGQTSVLLEIATNATDFKPGTISVQNGVAGSAPALGPIPEVPFVPALAVLGGVAAGAFVWRRRGRGERA